MRLQLHPWLPPLVAVTLFIGCSDSGSGPETIRVSREDSAGIELVRVELPTNVGEVAVLDGEPIRRYGGTDEPLFAIGSAIFVGPSGRVAAKANEANIVVFGSDGVAADVFGRRGEGPGEFHRIYRISSSGTVPLIVLHDLSRVSLLGLDGAYIGGFRVPFVYSLPDGAAVMRDSTVLALRNPTTPGLVQGGPGIVEGAAYMLHSVPGQVTPDTIHRLPGSQWQRLRPGSIMPASYLPSPHFTGRDTIVSFAAGGDYRIWELDGEGRKVRILDVTGAEVPFDGSLREAWCASHGRSPADCGRIRSESGVYERIFPAAVPAITDLMAASNGWLWVRRFPGEVEGELVQTWHVYDDAREFVMEVRMPMEYAVRDARDDEVLIVRRDEFDREFLEAYRWHREVDPSLSG